MVRYLRVFIQWNAIYNVNSLLKLCVVHYYGDKWNILLIGENNLSRVNTAGKFVACAQTWRYPAFIYNVSVSWRFGFPIGYLNSLRWHSHKNEFSIEVMSSSAIAYFSGLRWDLHKTWSGCFIIHHTRCYSSDKSCLYCWIHTEMWEWC